MSLVVFWFVPAKSNKTLPDSATLLDRTITREASPAALIDLYPIQVKARASRLTRPAGSYQLLDVRYFVTAVKQFKEYLAKDGVGDFHLGTFSTDRILRVHGRRALEPVHACQVMSPWIDFKIDPVAVDDGVGFHATVTKKVLWITAAEMKSAQFAKVVDVLEACANGSQLLLAKN